MGAYIIPRVKKEFTRSVGRVGGAQSHTGSWDPGIPRGRTDRSSHGNYLLYIDLMGTLSPMGTTGGDTLRQERHISDLVMGEINLFLTFVQITILSSIQVLLSTVKFSPLLRQ